MTIPMNSRRYNFIFLTLLCAVCIGCPDPIMRSDLGVSEKITRESSSEPARILFKHGKEQAGFFVALRTDSIEWYDSIPISPTTRHAIETGEVNAIVTRSNSSVSGAVNGGVIGFSIGGIAGCVIAPLAGGCSPVGGGGSFGNWNDGSYELNAVGGRVMIISAISGTVIGALIGSRNGNETETRYEITNTISKVDTTKLH
jgi:hypothetical protein